MKKMLVLMLLTVVALTLMGGIALAGGWSTLLTNGPIGSGEPTVTGTWNIPDNGSPHGNYSTASNKCRVCHAVHGAGAASWRLLRDGTNVGGEDRGMDRASECNYCHGAVSGVTNKKPYVNRAGMTMYGEHTIGSSALPDSNQATVPGGSLACGTCHSVHGAGVVTGNAQMQANILKNNPNPFNNLTVETGDLTAAVGTPMAGSSLVPTTADRWTRYCSDCHDKNPNNDTGTNDTTNALKLRPNGTSHVQGSAGDGSLEAYGVETRVANYSANPNNADLPGDFGIAGALGTGTNAGCRACHRASDSGNANPLLSASAFPHRTAGAKLLFDSFTGGAVQNNDVASRNDAQRALPTQDELCGKCHSENGAFGGAAGVGNTF